MQQPQVASSADRDRDIVERLRHGLLSVAFEMVVARYAQKIYRLCYSLLRDRDAAQDATQESLLRIWRALSGFDSSAALSTWIYTIARNRCFTALEQRRTMQRLESRQDHIETANAAVAMELQDHGALLRQLVGALPERCRRVLTLFYYQECSISEVATMLAMPEGTVKIHLHRARALLMTRMHALGMADLKLWLEEMV